MNTIIRSFSSAGIFFLALSINQSVFGFSTGVNGYSTNPATNAGNSCVLCHSGGTVPTVTLSGPVSVQPGTINTYTLTISGGQANSGGLDVSVDAGTLINTLASTKLQSGEITHTQRALADPNGDVAWSFDWQAPTTLGNYNIYSAGLSTNADSSTTGDAVATLATTVTVSAGASQPPVAVITAPQTAQVDTVVDFDGSNSQDPDSTIVSYQWDFGDGSTATGALTNHIYTAAGTYTVTLTVTDDTNLSDTTFRDISVGGVMIPIANPGGPYVGIEGQPVDFDGSQSTHVSSITNYIWDFGDGSPLEAYAVSTVSHTYVQPGAYTVTLAVQDANNITGAASTTVVISAVEPPPPPLELDGPTLYGTYCASCHLSLDQSTKLNRSAQQISDAIVNVGQMSGLSNLTAEQVAAIADALVSTTPPPIELDGPTLYGTYCASCHLSLDQSTKLNRSAQQISDAIVNVGQMSGLSNLTAEQVAAIADALVNTTPPPIELDGPTLYGTYCASCHLPLAESTKLNRSAQQISDAIVNVGQMSGLTGLTAEQVAAIADALVNTTPPPPTLDGAALYGTYCASCHLPLSQSTKTNRTATQIQNAINGVGQMSGLSSLTAEQVAAIADVLVTDTTPTTGEQLYDAYCLVCHGPGGTGGQYEGVTGSSANEISSAITEEQLMNSISLTSSQLQLIAGYLNGEEPAPPPSTGEQLYNTYCLACHGPGGRGGLYEDVTGESASEIADAIDEESLMNSILLNSSQIEAISDYLNGRDGGGTTPVPTDGASLYNTYCAGCHSSLANTTKPDRTATQIQSAINSIGQMSGLSSLTANEVQLIAEALSTGGGGTTPPPTVDGAALYTTYCASCHGQLASSTKANRTATQIQTAISAVGQMNSLSTLTTTEVQAIADALATGGGGGGTPSTGEQLYISYCQSCHGFNGTGGSGGAVVGVSANQISSALSSVGQMSGISLGSSDVQLIAEFLSSGGGTTPEPTTGRELYDLKCAACHGPGGTGGTEEAVDGASLREIQSAMQSVSVMQPIPLTQSQAQAIADYLNGGGHGGGDRDGHGHGHYQGGYYSGGN